MIDAFSQNLIQIYVISLKRSSDRRENVKKELQDIPFSFFDAVDGSNMINIEHNLHLVNLKMKHPKIVLAVSLKAQGLRLRSRFWLSTQVPRPFTA